MTLAETSQIRIVLTTAAHREEADRIAQAVVEQRIAACVNLIEGLRSVYRWQGVVESSAEVLLVIKTSRENLAALEAAIGQLHSYAVPEFLVLSAESGSQAYLAWIKDSLEAPGE